MWALPPYPHRRRHRPHYHHLARPHPCHRLPLPQIPYAPGASGQEIQSLPPSHPARPTRGGHRTQSALCLTHRPMQKINQAVISPPTVFASLHPRHRPRLHCLPHQNPSHSLCDRQDYTGGARHHLDSSPRKATYSPNGNRDKMLGWQVKHLTHFQRSLSSPVPLGHEIMAMEHLGTGLRHLEDGGHNVCGGWELCIHTHASYHIKRPYMSLLKPGNTIILHSTNKSLYIANGKRPTRSPLCSHIFRMPIHDLPA